MKTILIAGAALILGSQFAIANEAGALKAHKKPHGACESIAKACGAGGFKPGAHGEGKGLWMDCVDKVVAGGTVEGVTVTPTADELTACKTERTEMEAHAKKEHREKKGHDGQAKAEVEPTESK